jgi:hypothetical protein
MALEEIKNLGKSKTPPSGRDANARAKALPALPGQTTNHQGPMPKETTNHE